MPENERLKIALRAKFEGGDADQHILEGHSAAKSLEGLTWALISAINYGSTGKLKTPQAANRKSQIYIYPPKRGSVIFGIIAVIQDPVFLASLAGGYAVNTATPMTNGLVKTVFNQAMGNTPNLTQKEARLVKKFDTNELDALSKRIEPPLTRSHEFVDTTADRLILSTRRSIVSEHNSASAAYLNGQIERSAIVFHANVTSYNGVTGNGRLYFEPEKRITPFTIGKNVISGTRPLLSTSLDHFTRGHQGKIKLSAFREISGDGRLKRLVISAADEIPSSDWIDGVDPLRSR